jgi:probable rRNA maturation factor
MINIQIKRQYHQDGLKELIVKAIELTLKKESISEQEIDLSVVITSDSELQRLNNNHLGINNPTDVLSFPGGDIDPDTGNRYLGDIVISFQRVTIQAM